MKKRNTRSRKLGEQKIQKKDKEEKGITKGDRVKLHTAKGKCKGKRKVREDEKIKKKRQVDLAPVPKNYIMSARDIVLK